MKENEALKIELLSKCITDYKQSVGFRWGLCRMGQLSYEYGYYVTLAHFQAWYPDLEVDANPFTEKPEDNSVPMETRAISSDDRPTHDDINMLFDRLHWTGSMIFVVAPFGGGFVVLDIATEVPLADQVLNLIFEVVELLDVMVGLDSDVVVGSLHHLGDRGQRSKATMGLGQGHSVATVPDCAEYGLCGVLGSSNGVARHQPIVSCAIS
ncbi:hypothetical protein BHM03_00008059 [Ensete ventricosum]|nr:hypothetical protein BHM03_00008059 [Ensete ventricosum]